MKAITVTIHTIAFTDSNLFYKSKYFKHLGFFPFNVAAHLILPNSVSILFFFLL